MLLDLGYDFNIEGKNLSSDVYAWFEKDLFRFEKQRVGAVAWAYYQTSGPMSLAAYASWHRTVSEGLNGTVYVGAKFEADSAFDYKSFMKSYATYKQSVSAYNEYWQYLSDHGAEMTDDEYGKPIIIEDNCWIASNVIIVGGVTIGEGSVIGAGSVVTRSIPKNSLAVGNPCKVIREITEQDKIPDLLK